MVFATSLFTPFTEAHNRISNFNFFQALSLTPSTVSSALKIANVNGVDGHAGISTDYSNVAPRLGFAYSAALGRSSAAVSVSATSLGTTPPTPI